MAPINVYEKKQLEQIRGGGGSERKTMRSFIKVNSITGAPMLINAQAISIVEPGDDDATTLIWLVDRQEPVEAAAPFNTVVGWIWKAMEV